MSSVVKTVKSYGNSGGVYVPRKWVGGKVKIELIEEPMDPLDILKMIPNSEHVKSIIVYGSYARQEAEEGSDIDMLVITDNHVKGQKPGITFEKNRKKYHIEIKTLRDARNAAIHDPIFYKAIKDEAIALLNHEILDDLKKQKNRTNIKTRMSFAESSLGIVKELNKLPGENRDIVYPLMMRIKEMLLLECFLDNKKYSIRTLKKEITKHNVKTKEFNQLLEIYRAERDDRKIPAAYKPEKETINKLISILEKKILDVKKKAG